MNPRALFGGGWSIAQAMDCLINESALYAQSPSMIEAARAQPLDWGQFIDIGSMGLTATPQGGSVSDLDKWHAFEGLTFHRLRQYCMGNAVELPRLVAFGEPVAPGGVFQEIGQHDWLGISRCWPASSQIGNPTGPVIRNVLIFPVLKAPEAAERIAGLPLGGVLEKFVWGDPERESRLSVPPQFPDPSSWPGRRGRRHAALVPLTEDKARIETSLLVPTPEREISGLAPISRETAHIMASRLAALSRLLITGAVSVHAIRDGDNSEKACVIPPEDFRVPGLLVCLDTGDLWGPHDGQPYRRWHSVRIEQPEAIVAGSNLIGKQAAMDDSGPNARKSRPKASYEAAVTSVLKSAFRGDLVGKIQNGDQLIYAVQTALRAQGERREADTIRKVLTENYPFLWQAAKQ